MHFEQFFLTYWKTTHVKDNVHGSFDSQYEWFHHRIGLLWYNPRLSHTLVP